MLLRFQNTSYLYNVDNFQGRFRGSTRYTWLDHYNKYSRI